MVNPKASGKKTRRKDSEESPLQSRSLRPRQSVSYAEQEMPMWLKECQVKVREPKLQMQTSKQKPPKTVKREKRLGLGNQRQRVVRRVTFDAAEPIVIGGHEEAAQSPGKGTFKRDSFKVVKKRKQAHMGQEGRSTDSPVESRMIVKASRKSTLLESSRLHKERGTRRMRCVQLSPRASGHNIKEKARVEPNTSAATDLGGTSRALANPPVTVAVTDQTGRVSQGIENTLAEAPQKDSTEKERQMGNLVVRTDDRPESALQEEQNEGLPRDVDPVEALANGNSHGMIVTQGEGANPAETGQAKLLDMVSSMNMWKLEVMEEMSQQSSAADRAIQGLQDLSMFWKAEAEKQAAFCLGIRSRTTATLEEANANLHSTKPKEEERLSCQADLDKTNQELQKVSKMLKEHEEKSQGKIPKEIADASMQCDLLPTDGNQETKAMLEEKSVQTEDGCPETPFGVPSFRIFGRPSLGLDSNEPPRSMDVEHDSICYVDDHLNRGNSLGNSARGSMERNIPMTIDESLANSELKDQEDKQPEGISRSITFSPTDHPTDASQDVCMDSQERYGPDVPLIPSSSACRLIDFLGVLSDLSGFGFESKIDSKTVVQTHKATGFSFQLSEQQYYHRELKSFIASPADSRAIGYRLLQAGTVQGFLPSDLQVSMVFPKCDSMMVVEAISTAVTKALLVKLSKQNGLGH